MNRIYFVGLVLLTACIRPISLSRPVASVTPESGTQSPISPETETPDIAPTFEGCAYMWAYQPLPEISAQVDQALKELQPAASGRAQAFGEDCVYSDGHATFGAMETDFYVTLHVKNLKDMQELGNWIVTTMKALEAFPRGTVPGGQDGFVQITFVHEIDQNIRHIQIAQYKKLPAGTTGAEVMRLLFPNP